MSARISVLYSDDLPLHPNPVAGSLQLLWRLYNHPRAWRRALQQTTPDLKSNFCLLDLKPHHWQVSNIRRILIYGLLVTPLIVSLVSAVWLIATRQPLLDIYRGILLSFSYCLASTILMSLTHSLALGIGYGLVLGLGMAVPDSMGGILYAVILAAGLGGQLAIITAPVTPGRSMRGQIIGVAFAMTAILILILAGQLIMSGALVDSGLDAKPGGGIGWAEGLGLGLVGGLVLGTAYGAITWMKSANLRTSVLTGFGVTVICSISYSAFLIIPPTAPVVHLFGGIGGSIMYSVLFLLAYMIVERAGGPWAGAIAAAYASGMAWLPLYDYLTLEKVTQNFIIELPNGHILIAAVILVGLTLHFWVPIFKYPIHLFWNYLIFQRDQQNLAQPQAELRWNAIFWDEFQYLPLLGLDKHLVLVCEHNPDEGQAALSKISSTRQRWAARAAQIELDARQLERCQSIEAIAQAHQTLTTGSLLMGPASVILHAFSLISQDVQVALNHTSNFHQRLGLKAVEERLNNLSRELIRSSETYAERFYPVAGHWLELLQEHLAELSHIVEASQEIDNPYIVGVPLTEQQKVFVGRTDIALRLEQWLSDQHCPPLFLYGQRRMGKTSLLLNLGRLLHGAILPLFADGQYLAASENFTSVLAGSAREVYRSARRSPGLHLPALPREALKDHPFAHFNDWLDRLELALDEYGYSSALLALDEFDALYLASQRGSFNETDFLNMLRYLIQHRPRLKLLLTSARSPDEFGTWTGNLVNLRVIHMDFLNHQEALQLVEHPTQDFALIYAPEASQRVVALSGGHPFLLQLLCYEIVSYKNSQILSERHRATLADVEACIQPALHSGQFFFEEIQQQGIDDLGRELLRRVAAAGEGAQVRLIDPDQTAPLALTDQLQTILHRELLEEVTHGVYRFPVELIRRWFLN